MSRKGSLLERNVKRMFTLSGINSAINKIIDGYEIDVYVNYKGFQTALECKQYERSTLAVRNLIHQWDSKNKELEFDSIILVIVGIPISKKDRDLALKYGIIIWDESKFDSLFDKSIQLQKEFINELLIEIGYSKNVIIETTTPLLEKIDRMKEYPGLFSSEGFFPSKWITHEMFYDYYGSFLDRYNIGPLSEEQFQRVKTQSTEGSEELLVSILIRLLNENNLIRNEALSQIIDLVDIDKTLLLDICRLALSDPDPENADYAAYYIGEWGSIDDAEYLFDLLSIYDSKDALLALLAIDYAEHLQYVKQYLDELNDEDMTKEINAKFKIE